VEKIDKVKKSIKKLEQEEANEIREEGFDRQQESKKNVELDEATEALLDEIDDLIQDEDVDELVNYKQEGGE